MEVKKSTKANLEKGKTLSLMMGVVVALSILFVSFEWGTNVVHKSVLTGFTELPDEEELLPVTAPEPTPPPPPPPAVVVAETIQIVENDIEVRDIEIYSTEENPLEAPIENYIPFTEEEEEDTNRIFVAVENAPEFPGGTHELLQFLSRSIRYPVIAQESNIQGRVVCTFTVNTDGSVVDAEVIRGIDASLDKEALRVIGIMPKWKPGEQGGKKVRVRYTLPITFRLN